MKWKHQRIVLIVSLAVGVGILITVVKLQSPTRETKTGEARLRALLSEWQIALAISNRQDLINYARTSSPREGAMEYFKLKVRKEESEAILADKHLTKLFQFHRSAEFYNSPSRSWWSATPGATCFWGTIDSSDKKSSLTFYIVAESENYWLFIESLSGM